MSSAPSFRAALGAGRREAPLAGAMAVVASLCLPFARTGGIARSGLGLSVVLRSSGVVSGGPVQFLAVGVEMAPALAAVAFVLRRSGARWPIATRASALVAATIGLVGVAGGLVVLVQPDLQAAPGCVLSAIAGAMTLAVVVRPVARARQGAPVST